MLDPALVDSIIPAPRDEPDSGITVAVNRGFGRPDIVVALPTSRAAFAPADAPRR